MGYVSENLAPGELVVFRTHLHWKMFIGPLIIIIFAFFVLPIRQYGEFIGIGLLILAGFIAIGKAIRLQTAEFAVTNRRIIMKWGIIERHSYDLRLAQLETLNVEQDVLGRLFDFGRIEVIGSGGTRALTPDLADPLAFRLHAQSQSGQFESFDPRPPGTRVESSAIRECPYCAEPILAKAKVCKHCGRNVEPLSESRAQQPESQKHSQIQGGAEKATTSRDQSHKVEVESAKITELLCPSCGIVNQPQAKFCIYCGTSLPQASALHLCPNCGSENPGPAKFCNECGRPVK